MKQFNYRLKWVCSYVAMVMCGLNILTSYAATVEEVMENEDTTVVYRATTNSTDTIAEYSGNTSASSGEWTTLWSGSSYYRITGKYDSSYTGTKTVSGIDNYDLIKVTLYKGSILTSSYVYKQSVSNWSWAGPYEVIFSSENGYWDFSVPCSYTSTASSGSSTTYSRTVVPTLSISNNTLSMYTYYVSMSSRQCSGAFHITKVEGYTP